MLRDTAIALDTLVTVGVVHCDLPANKLLCDGGEGLLPSGKGDRQASFGLSEATTIGGA